MVNQGPNFMNNKNLATLLAGAHNNIISKKTLSKQERSRVVRPNNDLIVKMRRCFRRWRLTGEDPGNQSSSAPSPTKGKHTAPEKITYASAPTLWGWSSQSLPATSHSRSICSVIVSLDSTPYPWIYLSVTFTEILQFHDPLGLQPEFSLWGCLSGLP